MTALFQDCSIMLIDFTMLSCLFYWRDINPCTQRIVLIKRIKMSSKFEALFDHGEI
jgi:hypothetical protein